MRYLIAVLVLVGCDPQTLSCPTPDTCGSIMQPEPPPEPAPYEQPSVVIPPGPPSVHITMVQAQSLQWYIDCDTPTDYAQVFRSEVAWWNTQIRGIFAVEGDCKAKQGLRFWFEPVANPTHAGVGGPWGVRIQDARLVIGFLVTVARHEMGHAIGLAHGGADDCLMDATSGTPWQELCAAEIAAIGEAYPGYAIASQPPSTSANSLSDR